MNVHTCTNKGRGKQKINVYECVSVKARETGKK
jgi:hypothetical protein